MIGFVEVDITHIRKAYLYIKNDTELRFENEKTLKGKLSNLNDIVNTSAGRNNKLFKKKESFQVKKVLEELVYSSFISSSNTIILRVEMAAIIQDIIYIYEDRPDIEDGIQGEQLEQAIKTSLDRHKNK